VQSGAGPARGAVMASEGRAVLRVLVNDFDASAAIKAAADLAAKLRPDRAAAFRSQLLALSADGRAFDLPRTGGAPVAFDVLASAAFLDLLRRFGG
jgi:hypothetical protein